MDSNPTIIDSIVSLIPATIEDLVPIFQVAIAFCLAYLALDRFRYGKILVKIYDHAIKHCDKHVANYQKSRKNTAEKKPTDSENGKSEFRDTLYTELRKEKAQVQNGLKFKFLGFHLFSGKTKTGWDIIFSVLLLIFLVYLTLMACLECDHEGKTVIFTGFILSVVGIALPSILVVYGNSILNSTTASIQSRVTTFVTDTYPISRSTSSAINEIKSV
jgi:hypothetical protein